LRSGGLAQARSIVSAAQAKLAALQQQAQANRNTRLADSNADERAAIAAAGAGLNQSEAAASADITAANTWPTRRFWPSRSPASRTPCRRNATGANKQNGTCHYNDRWT
jgi:hypothetical protein